mmetsp:Transcript_36999/g.105245  ORF Transcript_36999/g.105245 Transcript_36999/m.105245 type:complete len:756 (-) Transcript_36999:12-2279(-)
MRGPELVLVVAALHRGQPVGRFHLAAGVCLRDLDEGVALVVEDLEDDDVDDADDRAAALLHQRRLAPDKLFGELGQRLDAVLPELRDVHVASLEELLQLLLVVADRRRDQCGDLGADRRGLELDLLALALLLGEPAEVPRVALAILLGEAAVGGAAEADGLKHAGVRGIDHGLVDLLAVDRAHAGVGGRVLLLLVALLHGVEFQGAPDDGQPLLDEALGGHDAVLVRQLLHTDELALAAHAPVGVLLRGLDEELLVGPLAVHDAEQHDVHNADDGLVLRGVQHEPGLTALDLVHELHELLRLTFAEVARVDAMALDHVLDALLARLDLRLGVVVLWPNGLALVVELGVLDLLGRPPLELDFGLGVLVDHLEPLGQLLLRRADVQTIRATLRRVLQALHQLAAALLDSGVGTGFADLRLEPRLHLLHLVLGGGADRRQPPVLQRLLGRDALALVPIERPLDEIAAVLRNSARALDRLVLRVLLAFEGETARDHAEKDNAQRPAINLDAVVQGVELGRPVRLRAAALLQPPAGRHLHHGTKIAQEDAAAGVLDVAPVLQVVVALDISVHDVVLVQPIDALEHHFCHVLADRDGDHALRLPMQLHALDHVAALVDLKDHADEDLLVVDVVKLHDAGVEELLEHLRLLLDLGDWGFDLVNHLDGELFLRPLLLARVHDAEGTLPQHLAQDILVQELIVLVLRNRGILRAAVGVFCFTGDLAACATHCICGGLPRRAAAQLLPAEVLARACKSAHPGNPT